MSSTTDESATAAAAIRIATRGSALALAQARLAAAALRAAGAPELAEVVIRTASDRHPDVPLERLEGQGWFVAELEQAVISGDADIAVHSAKDLPSTLGEGLCIGAYLTRADPRDALVTAGGASAASLPAGSRVGTSSSRRAALLVDRHPNLVAVPIRGNVDTRLRKLDAGEVDALLLAAAGLDRLGLGERATLRLDPREFVPAPAQGSLALETRTASDLVALCGQVDDPECRRAVSAERAVLAALGGGCLLPLGAWARLEGAELVVTAALASDGEIRRVELGGDPAEPEALGAAVAARLR